MTLIQDAEPTIGIELEHMTKSFGELTVLDDVSLKVEPGSVTALIGPSGAGKSTFLRCINLLERPDSGVIHVAGHTIMAGKSVKKSDLTALRAEVGMVFQSFSLFPPWRNHRLQRWTSRVDQSPWRRRVWCCLLCC